MKTLNIGKEFSPDPYGRYRTDGDSSGEAFREDWLKIKIQSLEPSEKLEVIIDDGIEGYGSSFLSESFMGMVQYGYISSQDLLDEIEIVYSGNDYEFYKNKIIKYIKEAKYNSKVYKPSKSDGCS